MWPCILPSPALILNPFAALLFLVGVLEKQASGIAAKAAAAAIKFFLSILKYVDE
jgi:hypothetical protein